MVAIDEKVNTIPPVHKDTSSLINWKLWKCQWLSQRWKYTMKSRNVNDSSLESLTLRDFVVYPATIPTTFAIENMDIDPDLMFDPDGFYESYL